MVAIWVIVGLIISAMSVSFIGAAFSILGLAKLFSGEVLAIWAMASSLEVSKFVLAAYLHQRWKNLGILYKSYLTISVVILSSITSMGIYGFLSDAYQSASSVLETETIKLSSLKEEEIRNKQEMVRIQKILDEVPKSRVTKKLQLQAEYTPEINALTKKSEEIAKHITSSNLAIVEVKQKVGPLIYIANAFKMNIDDIVKYLILLIVSVFDPLAICLVIATSEALESRKKQFTPGIGANHSPSTLSTNGVSLNQDSSGSGSPSLPQAPFPDSEPMVEILEMNFADGDEQLSSRAG